MSQEKILLVSTTGRKESALLKEILEKLGYEVTPVLDGKPASFLVNINSYDLVILGEQLSDGDGLTLGAHLAEAQPALPLIFMASQPGSPSVVKALRNGFWNYLDLPLASEPVLQVVQHCLQRRKRLSDWSISQSRRDTKDLQRRVEGLDALLRVGQSVTGSLDLDHILTTVVDAAVELTGAEEGSLLLVDEETGDLYMRAARNFQDEFVRTFRLPIQDTLAGQVVRTGKPVTLDVSTPQKIKTAYLVHTLVYVPLQIHGRVIGVLGVDNRQTRHAFTDQHLAVVSVLGDYAAVAIENAQAYAYTELERVKLETVLTKVEDGVIVLDHTGQLLLANHTVQNAFGLNGIQLTGKTARQVFQHPELLEILEDRQPNPSRAEITLEDGRVFNAQITPIAEIGRVVTMQDITHLKELDRIKSDFVSTVSHDLRTPLTAILGYVELIDRVGQLNTQQQEFIRRIQLSVSNITALINDLLDLGRIEAGFDARKEIVHLSAIVQFVLDSLRDRFVEKSQQLVVDLPLNVPTVLGNPIRLRQMVTNLIGNAAKYTPHGGTITVRARAEDGQVILQVEDNGPGIPMADQPYIFDKFYRGSNVAFETIGTGLGLAIVKSIVENHGGRVWVESAVGQGTTFTVVFPVTDNSL